jgi:hypothetical protein
MVRVYQAGANQNPIQILLLAPQFRSLPAREPDWLRSVAMGDTGGRVRPADLGDEPEIAPGESLERIHLREQGRPPSGACVAREALRERCRSFRILATQVEQANECAPRRGQPPPRMDVCHQTPPRAEQWRRVGAFQGVPISQPAGEKEWVL